MQTAAPDVLLIQVRDNHHVAQHEQRCFVERCQLPADAIRVHNVVDDPAITWDAVAGADAVIIGGAAAHSVTEQYPFSAPLTDVVRRLVDDRRPIFGSCWGHQFIAEALGGEVITDHDSEEVGTFPIELTEAGRSDPIFPAGTTSFYAHMGHHDRITALPPGAVELGYSERCRHQLFRLADLPIYGAQFHAEMTLQRLVERLSYYRDSYMPSDEAFNQLKNNPANTPEVEVMLGRFLEHFV